jgi:inosine-uridine nucleoside N-ribohydrolase
MKKLLLPLFAAALCLSCCAPADKSPGLIFDTDMAPDYDDVGALALLHALADAGEVEILATVSSNKCATAVPCIEVINTWFGRPGIPTGAVRGEATDRTTWHSGLRWTEELPKRYPHRTKATAESEDALELYRRILADRPDGSVTIVTVGFFTNLKNLLLSPPDKISPLSGKELVARKVKRLVSMAGAFPEGREFNVYVDPAASQLVMKEWPTPVLLSGFEIGSRIFTGKRLVESGIQNSPIIDTYTMCLAQDNPRGRDSWDQTATLVAVRGPSDYFDVEQGTITVNDDGSNTWTKSPDGRHARLVFKMPIEELTAQIEQLMMHQPLK